MTDSNERPCAEVLRETLEGMDRDEMIAFAEAMHHDLHTFEDNLADCARVMLALSEAVDGITYKIVQGSPEEGGLSDVLVTKGRFHKPAPTKVLTGASAIGVAASLNWLSSAMLTNYTTLTNALTDEGSSPEGDAITEEDIAKFVAMLGVPDEAEE